MTIDVRVRFLPEQEAGAVSLEMLIGEALAGKHDAAEQLLRAVQAQWPVRKVPGSLRQLVLEWYDDLRGIQYMHETPAGVEAGFMTGVTGRDFLAALIAYLESTPNRFQYAQAQSSDWQNEDGEPLALRYRRHDGGIVEESFNADAQAQDESARKTTGSKDYADIIRACEAGDGNTVREMLKRGVDPDINGPEGTPLISAVYAGKPAVVRLLLAADADVNRAAQGGHNTPLITALDQEAGIEMVKLLLAAGADPDLENATRKESPLWYAVMRGKPAIVRLLLAHGASPDGAPGTAAPIIQACLQRESQEHLEILSLLLERGADVDLPDDNGMTAIYHAAHEYNSRMVDMLIRHGANLDPPYAEQLPLTDYIRLACLGGKHSDRKMLEQLLAAGAPPGRLTL